MEDARRGRFARRVSAALIAVPVVWAVVAHAVGSSPRPMAAAPPQPAHIVLANLTGGMLTSSAEAIASLVRSGGRLILSGFDHTEVDGVLAAFAGFSELHRLSEDNWIALHLAR